jgi:hypothetical protein
MELLGLYQAKRLKKTKETQKMKTENQHFLEQNIKLS